MSYGIKYKGGFYSVKGTLYEINLLQDGYTGAAQDIAFSSTPLEIEWPETDKLDPIVSSNATLRLYSDTDRQFLDLYTIKAGAVRMDVYRDNALYWSGTLDPELYEEPYSYKKDYTVELTFADFAILDRLKWSEQGFATISEVINTALSATGINYGSLTKYVSTRLSRTDEDLLARIAVSGMNFFDEDDEAMSLKEVLEGVLKPFGLRIIQKAGKVWVYDIHALYSAFTPSALSWSSDDATLSADKVYNNVKITFSPYGSASLADAGVDKDSVEGTTYRYPLRPEDINIAGFDLALASSADSEIDIDNTVKYYAVTPLLTGENDSGVAQRVVHSSNGTSHTVLVDDSSLSGEIARLSKRIFICDTGNLERYKLRLKVDLLVDDRLNPYEEDTRTDLLGQDGDSVGAFLEDYVRIWCQFCTLKLYPSETGGTASYEYTNFPDDFASPYCAEDGSWGTGTGSMFLCYYEQESRAETCPLKGWKTNKQFIWNYWDEIPYLWRLRGDGEFIPMPPAGGYLDFSIYAEAMGGYRVAGGNTEPGLYLWNTLYRLWHLYRNIKIDLIDAETYQEVPQEDIVTTAWLNPDAEEPLDIETIVGCMDTPSPLAKGQLYDTEDSYAVVSLFSRNNVWDRLEKLLIGTIYSNYATRHHILSGETDILPTFATYTDANLPGVYLLLQETQDLEADTSSITAVEIDEDNYQGE